MADERWDEVIYLGDVLDFDSISKYNKDKPRLTENRRLMADYEHVEKMIDRHIRICRKNNGKVKFVLIEGNHEHRMNDFIDRHPDLEGIMEVSNGLNLSHLGRYGPFKECVKWVPFWSMGEVYRIGKAIFIHGRYTNAHHAKKHALAYGTNVFYGHTHDIQSYSVVRLGDDKTFMAQSLGCLCEYNQKYMSGSPSNWQQAITTFWFRKDGTFNHAVSNITNHKFVAPNGKEYRG